MTVSAWSCVSTVGRRRPRRGLARRSPTSASRMPRWLAHSVNTRALAARRAIVERDSPRRSMPASQPRSAVSVRASRPS